MKFATRAVHAGLEPDPSFGDVVPAIHQASTYVQKAPGDFVEEYDYSRSANPTRTQLEIALGELEGGRGTAFASGSSMPAATSSAACTARPHEPPTSRPSVCASRRVVRNESLSDTVT